MIIVKLTLIAMLGIEAITISPFIFVSEEVSSGSYIINHEKIHAAQQSELIHLPFYFLYSVEFCLRRIQYNNGSVANSQVSFERESHVNERDSDYLKKRTPFSFIKYL